MFVKVKVSSGKSEGKELTLRGTQFLIGRSEECNLRPQSDTISRKHCLIEMTEAQATIQDLGSRNGTLVNNQRIEGAVVLQTGDAVQIGALHFEVLECPSPAAVVAAPPRQAASKLSSDSGIISDWLTEADQEAKTRESTAELETRHYKFDDTDRIAIDNASKETITADSETMPVEAAAETDSKKKKKKRAPGKLPKIPEPADAPKDTQEAAAQMLRKFFKRG